MHEQMGRRPLRGTPSRGVSWSSGQRRTDVPTALASGLPVSSPCHAETAGWVVRGSLGPKSLSWRTHHPPPLGPLCHLWAPELGSTRPQQCPETPLQGSRLSGPWGCPAQSRNTPATGFPGHAVSGWPSLEFCRDPGMTGLGEAGPEEAGWAWPPEGVWCPGGNRSWPGRDP